MLRKYEVSVCGRRSACLAAPLGALIVFLAATSLTCSVDHGGIEPKQVSGRDAGPSDLLVALPDDASGDAVGPGTPDDGAVAVSGTGGAGTASGAGTGGAGASPPSTGGGGATGGMTGGMDTGGATGMGIGGTAGGGADNETGGAGPGGAATGGTGTGGAATGGPGTGGAAGGGAATGGAATGGRGTGGAATGGAATGGAATGGAASGGAGGAGGMTTGVCNAANCAAGCCSGTVCVNNTTALRCGHGGGICQVCGGCLRCSNTGSCEVDPMSQWTMTAVSATIAPKYPDGSDWDPGQRLGAALPDPFVQFEMPPVPASGNPQPGGVTGDTTTKMDTLSPLWNESILQPGTPVRARDLLAGGKPWLLWVGDEDDKLSADLVCQIMSPMDPTAFAAGGITRKNLGSCVSLSIKLTCQP